MWKYELDLSIMLVSYSADKLLFIGICADRMTETDRIHKCVWLLYETLSCLFKNEQSGAGKVKKSFPSNQESAYWATDILM